MLKSMTAYGRAESLKGDAGFVVEIKSGNNRYREIILRLPQIVQQFEDRIRTLVASTIKRGRVELIVQVKENGDRAVTLELNRPLVKAYVNIFNELNRELGSEQPLDFSFFSHVRDVIIIKHENLDLEAMWPDVKEVIEEALVSLETMRDNEGRAIEKDFLNRLLQITQNIGEIKERSKISIDEYRNKLIEKVKKLIKDIEINEERVMQEVAFVAERCDITEELVRIESHVEQFRYYISTDDAVGRRLDFLVQEINREINTIGSKASDSFISQRAVEVKAELEKLREQIQNVE